MLLSVGLRPAALHARFSRDTVQVLTVVIDAQTGEHYIAPRGQRKLRLVTTPRVAERAEKTRLAATYTAQRW